jgi:hypothetical protein
VKVLPANAQASGRLARLEFSGRIFAELDDIAIGIDSITRSEATCFPLLVLGSELAAQSGCVCAGFG